MRWTAAPRHRRASGLYVSRTSTRHDPLVGTRSPYIPGKGVSKLYPGDYELFWYVPGGKACAYLCRDEMQTHVERRYRPTPKGDTDPRRKETQTETVTRYRPGRSRGTDQRNLFDPCPIYSAISSVRSIGFVRFSSFVRFDRFVEKIILIFASEEPEEMLICSLEISRI